MKEKETTKNISIRTDFNKLSVFNKRLEEHNISKNAFFNNIIDEFIAKTNRTDFKTIEIFNNIESLGFKKSFLTIDDAKFIYDGVVFLERNNLLLEDTEEQKKCIINTYLTTGVKYEFKNIDTLIYSVFHFTEERNDLGSPILFLGNILYSYNLKTKVFDEITNDDLLEFFY